MAESEYSMKSASDGGIMTGQIVAGRSAREPAPRGERDRGADVKRRVRPADAA
jgi:hypothetical protein